MEPFDKRSAFIELPQHVYILSQLFAAHGHKLFAVGGVVRDFLYSKMNNEAFKPKDIDLATAALPAEVITILESEKAKTLGVSCFPKGASFGVISAIIADQEYEIATFREDWYDPENGDGRRPDKVQFSTPAKDAARRDLTMNALFYDLEAQEIRDYNLNEQGLGLGFDDLQEGIARPVGLARDRFREDKLRILRLVRFFSRFNKGDITHFLDQQTANAIAEFRDLKGVSAERIANEFVAGLTKSQLPWQFIRNCDSLGLMPVIFPNLVVDVDWIDTYNVCAALAWMLRDNGPGTVRNALNKLKYSNDVANQVEFLIKFYRMEAKNLVSLLKYRDLYKQLDTEIPRQATQSKLWQDMKDFALLAGPTYQRAVNYFLSYEPKAKFADFAHLQGAEISKAMLAYEIEMYNQPSTDYCSVCGTLLMSGVCETCDQ